MKVENMTSPQGNKTPNQFIITDGDKTTFQSYGSIIAIKQIGHKTIIGRNWDYSTTTAKYRNIFLGETTKETQAKIDNGTYIYEDTLK